MTRLSEAIGYFRRYLKPFWKGITLVVVLTLVATYFQVMAPVYMGKSVTALTDFITQAAKGHASMQRFFQAFWLMAVCFILNVVALCISWLVTSRFNAHSTNNMRKGLFSKLQRLTIKYFDTHQDGKILSLFNSDLDNVFNAMNNAVFEIISQSALFFGTIWIMLIINVKLALITMASTPFVVLISIIIMRKARKYLDKQQAEISNLNGYINEQINGQKVIITNGLQEESVRNFRGFNNKVRKAMFKGQLYSGLLFPLMNGLSLLNLAIVIAAGSLLIMSGNIGTATGLGLIVMFVQYSQQYFQPLMQLTSIYSMMQLAITGAKRLVTVEKQKEEESVTDGIVLAGLQKNVALKDVHFGYSAEKEILHGIDINVQKNHSVAIVGPTGSGKTTIINLLNRFYDVTGGLVAFDGVDVRTLTLESLRAHVGIVLQESVLFTGTIAENIAFGKPEASQSEIQAAAKKANIHDFILTLPAGYQTKVSNENSVFSTGQKQLISIARTLLTNPDLLILDEATSNVDTVTEEKIQTAMNNVITGRTSFIIAHRLKTIVEADEIIVLKDGKIIETGNHQALLAQKGFYYDLYKSQMAFD